MKTRKNKGITMKQDKQKKVGIVMDPNRVKP